MRVGIVDAANLSMRSWHGVGRGQAPDHRLAATQVCRQLATFSKEGLLDGLLWVREGTPLRRIEESEGDYKANRVGPPRPNDPTPDFFDLVWHLLCHLPVTCVKHPDYEADDVIASLAKDIVARGHTPVILTNDTDFLQLDGSIELLKKTGKSRRPSEKELRIKADGVSRGEQFLQWKALVGDPVDNIAGVKGIGAKTAVKIVLGGIDSWKKQASEAQLAAYENSLSMIRFEDVEPPLQTLYNGEVDWDKMRKAFHTIGSNIATTGWPKWQFSWTRLVEKQSDFRSFMEPWLS